MDLERYKREWSRRVAPVRAYMCRGFQNEALNRIVREFVPSVERVGVKVVPCWVAVGMRSVRRVS